MVKILTERSSLHDDRRGEIVRGVKDKFSYIRAVPVCEGYSLPSHDLVFGILQAVISLST